MKNKNKLYMLLRIFTYTSTMNNINMHRVCEYEDLHKCVPVFSEDQKITVVLRPATEW